MIASRPSDQWVTVVGACEQAYCPPETAYRRHLQFAAEQFFCVVSEIGATLGGCPSGAKAGLPPRAFLCPRNARHLL